MNKTIASLALLAASSSAFALIGPGPSRSPVQERTYCLNLSTTEANVSYVSDCDETRNNTKFKLELKENGCAEGQAALVTTRVTIPSCPSFVQL